MYTKVNVTKPGSNLGVGGNKKGKLTFFDMDDVLAFPARDSKGVVSVDNIQFVPGAYMITVYAIQKTIKVGHKGEGDPDKKGFIQTIEFEHPGDEVEIAEFDANWLNRNCGIIVEKCSNNRKKLLGTPCAPIQLTTEAVDDESTCHTKFSGASTQKGPIECDYQGTLTLDTVKGTPAANAVTVDVAAGEGQYQLTTGTVSAVALTGLVNPVDGNVYTLLGSGGAYPSTVAASGLWLLKNGTAWTALSGTTLTVKAFKDGASTYKYLELSRT
jgi:hypothetical protein